MSSPVDLREGELAELARRRGASHAPRVANVQPVPFQEPDAAVGTRRQLIDVPAGDRVVDSADRARRGDTPDLTVGTVGY
jgi:hypothetical protein